MAIDPKSPEYLFGEILTKIKGLESQGRSTENKIDWWASRMQDLPCISQDNRLKVVEKLLTNCHERDKTQHSAKISLRTGLIIAGFSAVISALLTLLLTGLR